MLSVDLGSTHSPPHLHSILARHRENFGTFCSIVSMQQENGNSYTFNQQKNVSYSLQTVSRLQGGLPGFNFQQEHGSVFATASKPSLVSTQPSIQYVSWVISPGIK
jgi:hypothetical protein